MQSLIVYFSLEGNTKWAATQIAGQTGADVLELVPKKAYPSAGFGKFFWGGKSAVFGESPELEPYDADLSQYERVILATPIWAGTFAPPLRTFIQSANLSGKHLAFVACSGGGSAERAFSQLKALTGAPEDAPALHLVSPKARPSDENASAIAKFCDELSNKERYPC